MNLIGKILGATALVAGFAVGLSAPASAGYSSQFNTQQSDFTDTYAPLGGANSLLTATSVTFTDENIQLSNPATRGPLYQNNALMTFSVHTFGLSGGVATWSGPFTVTWVAGVNTFQFTASNSAYSTSSQLGANYLNLTFIGTVISTNDPTDFPIQQATFGLTAVDTGSPQLSVAGKFVTPVPEPISMVVIGAGLAGLAAVRRRRASV